MRLLVFVLAASIAPAQYAGGQACKICHAAKFESQSKTGHARALAVAPPGSPGHWAFGAGAKAITYVSQADPDAYIEHALSYYPATKSMASTPGHSSPADLRFRTFDISAPALRCFQCHSTRTAHLPPANTITHAQLCVRSESFHQ